MATGIIRWYDEDSTDFAIVERNDTNRLIILDTSDVKLPEGYLKEGDKISFEVRLSQFGPVAEEITKL